MKRVNVTAKFEVRSFTFRQCELNNEFKGNK